MLHSAFEEYIFAIVFGALSWISSLQFAKLYPHNVKYGKYVLYLHSLLCILGIYEVILSYFEPTQLHSIQHNANRSNKNLKILLIFCIPAHFELFITNFIIFQWIKIYFSVGVTEGWLVCCKWFMVSLSIISFISLLTSFTILSFNENNYLINIIYAIIMYIVASYCILMSISFISVAYLLMKRVLKTSNLSGITTDRSVCRRLLGSGIVLSTSYFIQGTIIYLLVSANKSVFLRNIRWLAIIFKFCIIMIMANTLLLYSKIIQQRLTNHWRKWAKSTKLWDLNTSRKRRKNTHYHRRADTEEIAFDPADIQLIRQLSHGRHGTNINANLFTRLSSEDNMEFANNVNRKATQKYANIPLNMTANGLNKWSSIDIHDTIDMDEEGMGGKVMGIHETINEEDFDIIDELFDAFLLNSSENELGDAFMAMDEFETGDDNNDNMVDVMEVKEEENADNICMDMIEMDKFDELHCGGNGGDELENSETAQMVQIQSGNVQNMENVAVDFLDAVINEKSLNSQQYNLAMGMSADIDCMSNCDIMTEDDEATINGNNQSNDIVDEEILNNIFENGLNSPSKSNKSPQKAFKLETGDEIFNFPFTQNSQSKTVTNNYIGSTLQTHTHFDKKPVLKPQSLKVTSSAPQSPTNNLETLPHISTNNAPNTPTTTITITPTKTRNAMDPRPGMFKSKSMQKGSPNTMEKMKINFQPKIKTFTINPSFDELDVFVDQFTDSELPQTPKCKNESQPFTQTMYDSDSNHNLLDITSAFSSGNEEDQFQTEYHASKSPKSASEKKMTKKNLATNQKNNIKLRIIDTDYRKTKEYKNILNDSDIIANSFSNPRFWKYLRKKHAKQINPKALEKFTFSFEKARYQPLLSRQSIITPCSSPKYSDKKKSETINNLRNKSGTNSVHFRSVSDHAAKFKKSQKSFLNTIQAKQEKSSVPATQSIQIEGESKKVSISRSPTITKSPLNFSSATSSKSPVPGNVKKKELLSFSKPLTPLALSSKFKKAQQTFFGGNKSQRMSINIGSQGIILEHNKLNKKRRHLESHKKRLDIGGVSAKLDYWKANQLRHDPRWKILGKKRSVRGKTPKVYGNKSPLKARQHLKLANFPSDPVEKKANGLKPGIDENKNKVAPKWKNMFGRFGNNKEYGMKQQVGLQVQHSPYIGDVHIDGVWKAESIECSSDSDSTASSSSGGEYSNSDEHNHEMYASPSHQKSNKQHHRKRGKSKRSKIGHKHMKYSKKDKKCKSKPRIRRHRRSKKSSVFSNNSGILSQIFGTDATDSDGSDIEINSSLKTFQKLKAIQTVSSGKYMRTKSCTPRTPFADKLGDICEWEAVDVLGFMVQSYPELDIYKNNILKCGITGIEFVCMQKTEDFKTRLKITNSSHIGMLLDVSRTLLMEYNGGNKEILNVKLNLAENRQTSMKLPNFDLSENA